MSDSVMTAASEMDALIPEVWSAAFFPTLLEKLPFNDSVGTDYDGEISSLGDTVNILSFPQFSAAQEILENERADADAVTASKTQLVINKQVVKDFILTKKALAQSIDAQQKLRDLAFHAIMKKMQNTIIGDISPSASSPDHSIAYDSGTTLALADILEAKELLDDADCEEEGRVMITGSGGANDLFNITGMVSRDYIPAGSPMTEGAIKTPVLGFQFKWTSEAGTVTRFFHPMFMQLAVQQKPDVTEHPLGSDGRRGKRINTDVLYGVKQVSNLRVVSVS
jgi:hypothetical protein